MPFIRVIIGAKPGFIKETRSSETSTNVIEALTRYFFPLKSINEADCDTPKSAFEDLIFPRETKEGIIERASSICNSREQKSLFNHVILHGPDKVGKFKTAKRLARVAGIEFAHVYGPDIATTGEEAVSQIQTLFSWAKMSRNGMLLFIDESDVFLGSTGSSLMNETSTGNNALSVFLYNMAKLRTNILLVLEVNR